MKEKNLAIGFFDSGLGGLSVLKEALKILPDEKYIYFGDSINAPYGNKPVREVFNLTRKNISFLLEKGIKALVIACNTATSVAIEDLRNELDLPVIGMEPAIKPAANSKKNGRILLLATEMTLKEDKLKNLIGNLDLDDDIIKVPAPQLVTLIENGKFSRQKAIPILQNYLNNYDFKQIDSVVLGCTHFVFYREIIAELVDQDTRVIDGNKGTVRHLKNRLEELGLVRIDPINGKHIDFYNSDSNIDEEIQRQFLKI